MCHRQRNVRRAGHRGRRAPPDWSSGSRQLAWRSAQGGSRGSRPGDALEMAASLEQLPELEGARAFGRALRPRQPESSPRRRRLSQPPKAGSWRPLARPHCVSSGTSRRRESGRSLRPRGSRAVRLPYPGGGAHVVVCGSLPAPEWRPMSLAADAAGWPPAPRRGRTAVPANRSPARAGAAA